MKLPIIKRLLNKYGEKEILPCPICGHARNSICAAGGGKITYCCGSDDANACGKAERFDECMDHFSKSRYEVSSGDIDVVRLCKLYLKLKKLIVNIRRMN